MTDYELLNRCYLDYKSEDKRLTVGVWTEVLNLDTCEIEIHLYVDPDAYARLAEFGLDTTQNDLITSTFLLEWHLVFKPYPEFIRQRSFHPRRPDRPWEQEPYCMQRYENFEFVRISHGYWFDNWCVHDEPSNPINIEEPVYSKVREGVPL